MEINNLASYGKFKDYDYPEKAYRIVEEYLSELITLTEKNILSFSDIIFNHNTCAGLDFGLDAMLSRDNDLPYPCRPSIGGYSGPLDADSGYYNIARKQAEENTNHNPFLVS